MAPEENRASSKGEALLRTMRNLLKSKNDRKLLSVLSVYMIFVCLLLPITTPSLQLELCLNFLGVNPWVGQQMQHEKLLASSFCKRQSRVACVGLC